MRCFTCVVLVVMMSCSRKESSPAPPPAPVTQPTRDAPAVPDEPGWAKDPPEVLRGKINAVNAHVVVLKGQVEFPEWRDVLATVEKTEGVVAAEPLIFAELQIAKQGGTPIGFAIKGVDPKRVDRVLGIGKHMKVGMLDSLAAATPSIVLGDDLAKKLGVQIGDEVTVSQPDVLQPDQIHDLPAKEPGVFRVGGLFHIDFDEYDEKLALVPLAALQQMLARGDQVMGIEMTVKDLATSDVLARTLEAKLGGAPYRVLDWYELNEQLFTALFGSRRP